jgi:DNA invertase Pin-like site-specific DNA recombinase
MLDNITAESCDIAYARGGGVSKSDASITALYCRVANAGAESIAMQEEILRRYANDHGYSVYKVYRDNGKSGITLDRPGLQSMLEDIKSGKVKRVVIFDFVRLARDYVTARKLKKIFDMYGVELVSVRDSHRMKNLSIHLLVGEIQGYE